jgi:hypothetical protein
MTNEHLIRNARAITVGIGAGELPLVGKASEGRIGPGDVPARISNLASIRSIHVNDLHLLDPGVRISRLQERDARKGDCEEVRHAKLHGAEGLAEPDCCVLQNVVCEGRRERRRALSLQGL